MLARINLSLLACLSLAVAAACAGDEPPLPQGLGPATTRPADDEPELPTGLDSGEDEPALPDGLGDAATPATAPAPPEKGIELFTLADVTGFWEVRGGVRTQHDRRQKHASIGETRLQLELEKHVERLTFKLTADLLYDAVLEHHTPDLEAGEGFLDLRQASVSLSPVEFMDVKVGRQVLTWGTGDMVFINDLFPKDWQSFFNGRHVEYLKAPSDAVKVSLFSKLANVDVVFTPVFDADRYIRGRRLSYWNNTLGRLAGRDAVVDARRPNEWFDDAEWAVRVFRNLSGYELAAYGYWGFWKSPAGVDAATGDATFPRLSVYGGSVRGKCGRGIAHVEAGYYDSRQDPGGDDPRVANSQLRLLAGYEQDLPQIARDFTVGVQYYVEWMMDHAAYRRTLPAGGPTADEVRHVVTVRLRKLLMDQNLTLSLFAYYSPSDSDAYLRPNVSYKIDDRWTVEVGANAFFGAREHTFFGQFRNNSNVYAALRCGF